VQALWRSRVARWIGLGVLIAIPVWLALREFVPTSAPSVCTALAERRIVHLFVGQGVSVRCEGVRIDSARLLGAAALDEADAAALTRALAAHKGSALALLPGGAAQGVGKQIGALAHVPGMRGVLLSPELAIYAPTHELALSASEREALAYVARVLFRGAREPSVTSFPAALRRVERVEVMVMLSKRGEPRLWRSARGTSIARALLTATRVARDRWREREQAMGGPLPKMLVDLDVEVSLLSEDGALGSAQRTFVDRAITPAHGLGFDYRTAWHYLLPGDVARHKEGPFHALSELIVDQGLPLSILGESDTRVYRFVPVSLGVSKAPLSPSTR
jgi:hypothetical protein